VTATLLGRATSPARLKELRPDQLPALAAEIREFLVETVSATGGHLGPNLGVVELTIALHRVSRGESNTRCSAMVTSARISASSS